MENFEKIQVVFANLEKDMQKVANNNKAAIRRARKNIMALKSLGHVLRKELTDASNAIPTKVKAKN